MFTLNVSVDDLSENGINCVLSVYRKKETPVEYASSWQMMGDLIEDLKLDVTYDVHGGEKPWTVTLRDESGFLADVSSETACSAVARLAILTTVGNEIAIPLSSACKFLKSTNDIMDMIIAGNELHECSSNSIAGDFYVVTFTTDDSDYIEGLRNCLSDLESMATIKIQESNDCEVIFSWKSRAQRREEMMEQFNSLIK
ncbi:TPA: hypothetical protein MO340_004298 [Salmonella enterica subsp. salamae serovar 35:g,m,s,t:-]|nr:hypothetical protein [Salmonella enterica subsp. salamae serovar 35:g,m,s,t:-]HCA3549768.1 hypothetical protein [Salmonella enterica subsp. salamae serovar 35:g,m,s,t:-]